MFEELMPTLNLPESELRIFASQVLERFNNPFVDHQVTSIMLNSFSKYSTRDLSGLKLYKENAECLIVGLAAIIVYYNGYTRNDGVTAVPNDSPEVLSLLEKAWQADNASAVAMSVLRAESIWGEDLNTISGLTESLAGYIGRIQNEGMEKVLATMFA